MHDSQQFQGNDYASSIIRNSGAVLTGHFSIESEPEMHSEFYISKQILFSTRPGLLLGRQLKDFLLLPDEIEIIVAPPPFGLFVAIPLGEAMSRQVVQIDEYQGKLCLRRGAQKLIDGRKVLAVDCISISGGKLRAVSKLVALLGGIVVEQAVLIDRGAGHPTYAKLANRPTSLVLSKLPIVAKADCPDCVNKVGLSEEFGLASKAHGLMLEDSIDN